MRHLYFSSFLITPRMWGWHSTFRGARGRNKAKIRQRKDANVWREVSEKASVATQLPLAEELQWSTQTVIYDDFLDSSICSQKSCLQFCQEIPFFWFLLSNPSLPIAVQNTLVWMKPVSAWTVQLLLCPVVILLTSMAHFSFLLSATFCIGFPLNPDPSLLTRHYIHDVWGKTSWRWDGV